MGTCGALDLIYGVYKTGYILEKWDGPGKQVRPFFYTPSVTLIPVATRSIYPCIPEQKFFCKKVLTILFFLDRIITAVNVSGC
ncbi:hypothetical protein BDD39_001243 [Saccharococcus thermophilus]|uniref:Uncharacterized protein n=1 Tax=Saccharococcus thermophilus TaxID=29396 RepID=A0A846MG86_9BACL|nr:hypothetical protein [Saccharococcus thermophilus]